MVISMSINNFLIELQQKLSNMYIHYEKNRREDPRWYTIYIQSKDGKIDERYIVTTRQLRNIEIARKRIECINKDMIYKEIEINGDKRNKSICN